MLLNLLTTSSILILLHGIISLPDATSCDKYGYRLLKISLPLDMGNLPSIGYCNLQIEIDMARYIHNNSFVKLLLYNTTHS